MTLQTHRLHTMEQVRAFVEGNEAVDYKHQDRASAYAFVSELLGRLCYRTLGKRDKGTFGTAMDGVAANSDRIR